MSGQYLKVVTIGLLVLITHAAEARGRQPCSGSKGGISHCDGGRFVCNDGSYSASKRTCSGYSNQSSPPPSISSENDVDFREQCAVAKKIDTSFESAMEQYSTTADFEKIFDGAVSGYDVCKARADIIEPAIEQANNMLAPYIGVQSNESQVAPTVFSLVKEFGFSTQTLCNMAKIGTDKNKLKSEWRDSRPHWVRYIELAKKIKATCQ
ncbi:hypothetical protein ACEUB2_11700 [Aeromonas veronii]|uniref:Uncharacterized protein n=1 Tax=Aeromonas veronii TaxID=654 RepID=A0A2T4N3J0_AERVE|nr:hypothetical protein [Aeromonas veronii]MCX0444662.1 hypothetical protein [Aeromonas veronii]PTH81388.1 hypothetical protein DAA48_09590 [Aeromonas veronii]RDE59305.1 hypothetical protein DV708_22715 [Aeromonas veronii]